MRGKTATFRCIMRKASYRPTEAYLAYVRVGYKRLDKIRRSIAQFLFFANYGRRRRLLCTNYGRCGRFLRCGCNRSGRNWLLRCAHRSCLRICSNCRRCHRSRGCLRSRCTCRSRRHCTGGCAHRSRRCHLLRSTHRSRRSLRSGS